MKNFLYGIFGGIANITPGISGSACFLVLGIYEKAINAISNIFKDFKRSMMFLIPLGLGVLVGIFLFSNIIKFFLKHYPLGTSIVMISLLITTIPLLFKQALSKNSFKWSYLIYFFIALFIGIILLMYRNNTNISYTYNIPKLLFSGFILAMSTIIPGVSSTILLSMINMYNVYINAISTLNIKILFFLGLGFISSAFFISKIINYLLKKYYSYVLFFIIGFTISTIPSLIKIPLVFNKELLISLVFSIIIFLVIGKFSFKVD